MNCLGRIFKSEEVVRISEAVKIPDCVIRVLPEKKPAKISTVSSDTGETEKIVLTDDTAVRVPDINDIPEEEPDTQKYEDTEQSVFQGSEISEHGSISFQEERDRIFIEREAILKQAELEAKKMLEDAQSESEKILSEAKEQVEDIVNEAKQRGYDEGVSAKKSEIDEILQMMQTALREMRKDQEDFFDESAEQLKFLAIEIAEKIMAQKLEIDPELIIPLVKSAVKSLRDISWIKVEISDKLNQASGSLERSLNELKPDASIEVESRRNSPAGTCVVHTAEGVTVASVLTQIDNITKYFSEYRDNDYDERESGSDKTQKESESQ